MNNLATVSIVIPAKNEAVYIGATLASLAAAIDKSGCKCDIVLADNGSTDSTVEIAKSFGCWIIQDKFASIARLRNLGANATTGEILAFLDADCVVDNSWISLCAEKLSDERIGLIGTRAIPDLSNSTWVEDGWYKLFTGVARPDNPKWIGSSNMFVRRNVFHEVGGFDDHLLTAEDVNFCNKIRNKYLIELEKSIDTVHLRESKTVRELLRREFCRGKGSIRQFIISNCRSNELLSILTPLCYICLVLMTLFLAVGSSYLFIVTTALILLAPIALLIKKKALIKVPSDFFTIYVVASLYIISRSFAMVYEILFLLSKSFKALRTVKPNRFCNNK